MITLLGRPVRVKSSRLEPVPDFNAYYQDAVAYLRQSSAAAALIHFLETQTDEIYVACIKPARNGFAHKEYVVQACPELDGSLVRWRPFRTMGVNDVEAHMPVGRLSREARGAVAAGCQSPAMGLIHEFGHARQYLLKRDWYLPRYAKAMDGDNKAMLELENDNLRTVESVVARQLGEGVRWEYKDDDIKGDFTAASPAYYMRVLGDPLL